jgi:hypothetical protein
LPPDWGGDVSEIAASLESKQRVGTARKRAFAHPTVAYGSMYPARKRNYKQFLPLLPQEHKQEISGSTLSCNLQEALTD